MKRRALTEVLHMSTAFSCVALVAGSGEVIAIGSASPTMGLNMVNHSAHIVKEWRFVSPPARIMVSEWPGESVLSDKELQISHHWSEDYGTAAPSAHPTVTLEYLHLKSF
jgi:hypothetical protein